MTGSVYGYPRSKILTTLHKSARFRSIFKLKNYLAEVMNFQGDMRREELLRAVTSEEHVKHADTGPKTS